MNILLGKDSALVSFYLTSSGFHAACFPKLYKVKLKRCRDHGEDGMERYVGWGLLASDLWQIRQACAKRTA